MTKFDEIRSAVTNLVTENEAYWNKLYKVMTYFNSHLMSYWGITQGVVLDNAGRQHAVFATGTYDESEKNIVPKAPFMLRKEGKKLCFDLLLNLPQRDDNQIAIRKLIEIKYRYENGVYLFEEKGIDSVISCNEVNDKAELTPFFDALHAQILNHLQFTK